MEIKKLISDIRNNPTIRNMAISGISKPIAMLLSLVYVRFALQFLGVEKYGVWSTLLTILSTVSYFDIGIGNGLRNKLTEALSKGEVDKCKDMISSAYAFVAVIMGALIAIVSIVAQFINWAPIFGVGENFDESLPTIISISILFIGTNFVFAICRNVLYALQKAAVVSILELITQIINLGLIVLFKFTTEGSVLTVAVLYGASMIFVNFGYSILLFARKKQLCPSIRAVSFTTGKKLTTLGLQFFIIQICALVLYSTDSLIISILYGASDVTPYATVNKVFNALASMYIAFLAPIWSAFTKTNALADYGSMKRSIKRLQLFMIPFFAVAIIIACFFKPITAIWLGQELDYVYGLIPLGLAFCVLSIWTNTYAYIANGLELMKVSMIVAVVQAVLNIPLSILFAKVLNYQAAGVLGGTVAVMAIAAIVMPIYVHKWIKKKIEGQESEDLAEKCLTDNNGDNGNETN